MTPEEQRAARDSEQPIGFLSHRLMSALSIVMVVALILGSASTVLALTDWGLNVAALIGLVMALLLILVWVRMPKRGPQ